MKEKMDILQRLTEGMDLACEPLPGQFLVEIAGNNRVLVENHRGVVQYGTEEICVKVSQGRISIKGENLSLAKMTREQLIIFGNIRCVSLLGRCQ